MQMISPTRLSSFNDMQDSNFFTQFLNICCEKPVQPNYKEYVSLQRALCEGDVEMDKVIDWVMQDPKGHRMIFEKILFQGRDNLSEPLPTELENFFNYIEQKPEWLDQRQIDEAVKFTHRLGINNGFILRDLSLMAGYLYPGFNQPLILTGALKKQAGTRLAETTKWWVDITEPQGLERLSTGFISTIYVRFIHALVRRQLKKSDRWDSEVWGVPLNQFDLAMTNLAFSSVVLLGIRALGVWPTKQETKSFLHFWRYVGWLMGIDEKWLIQSESEGWRLLYWMQFAHPRSDHSSVELGSSLSKEPFERKYLHLRSLQQKLAYRQHLELTQFFIGKKRMKLLGLPHQSASWFAYYLIVRNSILYNGAKLSPKIEKFLSKSGRNIQKLGLTLYQNQGKAKTLASMHQ